MSQNQEPEENFIIEEEYPDHHFRTELPNILEEIVLTDIQFRIYWAIKKIAGDKGKSWSSIESIAKKCQCGVRAVQNNLPFLAEKFAILENRPLIKIQKRKRANGSYDTNLISIVNIWDLNGKLYREKFKNKVADPLGGGGAPNAPGVVHQVHQGGAPNAPKEETEKKNSDEEYTYKGRDITETSTEPPTPKPPISASISDIAAKSLPFHAERKVTAFHDRKDWTAKMTPQEKVVFHEAMNFDPPKGPKIEGHFVTAMFKEYGVDKFKEAFEHSKQSLEKTQIRESFGGMVRNALKKGFKAKDEKFHENKELAKKVAMMNPNFQVLEKYICDGNGWSYNYSQHDFVEVLLRKADSMGAYV